MSGRETMTVTPPTVGNFGQAMLGALRPVYRAVYDARALGVTIAEEGRTTAPRVGRLLGQLRDEMGSANRVVTAAVDRSPAEAPDAALQAARDALRHISEADTIAQAIPGIRSAEWASLRASHAEMHAEMAASALLRAAKSSP